MPSGVVCPSHSDCVNTRGGHVCECEAGFFKNSTGQCQGERLEQPPSAELDIFDRMTVPVASTEGWVLLPVLKGGSCYQYWRVGPVVSTGRSVLLPVREGGSCYQHWRVGSVTSIGGWVLLSVQEGQSCCQYERVGPVTSTGGWVLLSLIHI